ncbi:unnamed protein product [Arabidopsis halleri]
MNSSGGSVGGNNLDHEEDSYGDVLNLEGYDLDVGFNENVAPEAVPTANVGVAGVNIPQFRGLETEYVLSLIQDSLTLGPSEIHSLLTNPEIEITPVAPYRPQPPALFKVRKEIVDAGMIDGYTWRKPRYNQLKIDDVNVVINGLHHENAGDFPRQTFRRIYDIKGQSDLKFRTYLL